MTASSDLFWPGDQRAGSLLTSEALLGALARVEEAWLGALVESGMAPAAAAGGRDGVAELVGVSDLAEIAGEAEDGGNPVIGLVRTLRSRLRQAGHEDAARWLHRGLTSQDVFDTGLVLCLTDAVDRVGVEVASQAAALARLARDHRHTLMVGRTLTQHAVPTTFGLKAAGWLDAIERAHTRLRRARGDLAVQVGGAAGTLAGLVELADGDIARATRVPRMFAETLMLPHAAPWHTERGTLTATGDALVGFADVWGRIGADVALRARPEIAELREPVVAGRGGSSTMPHKANPVLSVLLRRHGLTAPSAAATLHLAAASYVDERPDGGWHAEWDALRTLGRHSVVAASQASELLDGLVVDAAAMRRTAEESEGVLAEQESLAALAHTRPATAPQEYLGAADALIDAALERAARTWKELA